MEVASSEPCPYPLNIWIEETTAYGLKIYVIYSTKTNIRDAMYTDPLPENNYLMAYDSDGSSIFTREQTEQVQTITSSLGMAAYGYHYVYPAVKIGTYAEGTIYKISAGVHLISVSGDCPDRITGKCQAGTID